MSTQTDLLRKIDFFEPLDQKIINKIAQVCIAREYSAGDHIVKQGESGLGLFFITRGRVKVEIERNGSKAIVAQLQAEDFLGELSIIDNKPRSANVICLEDTSCLLLTRDSFSKLMNKYPEIAIQMAKALAGRIRATNEKMGQPIPTSADGIPAPAAPQAPSPAPASGAAAPSGAAAAKPADNGSSASAAAKDKLKDFLVDTFSFMYTVKAFTRFSVALVGCPVEVRAETGGPEVLQANVGGVKLALFPASQDQVLRIDAFGDGDFSAVVLRPAVSASDVTPRRSRFVGQIRRNETLRLHVSKCDEVRLEGPSNAAIN